VHERHSIGHLLLLLFERRNHIAPPLVERRARRRPVGRGLGRHLRDEAAPGRRRL